MQLSDDVEVLLRDVVVVLLHFTEGGLVVDHEIVDVLVLALLNLVDLDLHTEGQLLLEFLQLLLVNRDQVLFVGLKGLLESVKVLLMVLRLRLDLRDVGLVVTLVVLLLVLFAVTIIGFGPLMVLVLLSHDLGSFGLGAFDSFLVLVLVVLHLLKMRDDQGVVCLLLLLHLRIEVLNVRLQLFDLLASVLVEVMDHILLDLECVALHLRVL